MKSIKDDEQITSSCLHYCVDIDIKEPLSCHGDFLCFGQNCTKHLTTYLLSLNMKLLFAYREVRHHEKHIQEWEMSKIEADISLSEKRHIYIRLYYNSCNAIQTTNVCNF